MIACRLPGDVNSASALWSLLEEERSGQCDIPSSRFNIDAYYQPGGPEVPGGMNTKGGYFIKEDIREFDNDFFGILNAEATHMDPQQRKLLEVVFECFESAGVSLEQISGSDTGCYVSNFSNDYLAMMTKDPEYLDRFSATGMGATILGNRISHAFNMLGPSLVIDTACSSSLYCLHVACAALADGDCDAAIVAGANLIQSVEQHLAMMKAGVLSATSTCHTFSDQADGYARADGIGSLYLKRLSDALRDNDPVRAVIRGSAVGSNGKTRGISAPSATAQEAVIRKAYQKAGLDFDATQYIECHGTGTPVGDPIEVEALSRVFKRTTNNPLLIGSVKTNVGHSEAVSGLSGIIKTVLALENGRIPPTIGVGRVNPKIKTAEWGIEIVTKNRDWPVDPSISPSDGVRRAGVNSFGYGGANGHVILEAADSWMRAGPYKKTFELDSASRVSSDESITTEESEDYASTPASDDSMSGLGIDISQRNTFLLPFSATSTRALEARVSNLKMEKADSVDLADLAYTLACRRTHFPQRGFIVARRGTIRDDLRIDNLRSLPNVKLGSAPSDFAFVFTGQGAQWPGMGKELFEEFPTFRKSIQDMDKILQNIPEPPTWTLEGTIFAPPESSPIHESTCAQPMATAIQVAIVELLTSWDITPKMCVGHSSGEVAAAFASGYISRAQAITAAFYRGYVNGVNKLDGAMMAVGLGRKEADEEIVQAGLSGKVVVACVNSPISVTMSGDLDAVTMLLEDFQKRGIFARKLNTGGKAYHSHHMAVLGPELERLLPIAEKGLPSSIMNKKATFVSSVTAEPKTSDFDATYWRQNMENAVLFGPALEYIASRGDVHLIEIGPHSALELPIKQIRSGLKLTEERLPYSSALTRGQNGARCSMNLLGRLFLHGHPVCFNKVNSQESSLSIPRVLSDMAPYPRSYDGILWSEPRISREVRNRKNRHQELLGSQVPGGDGLTITWRNLLQVKYLTWLEHHKRDDLIIFPPACYISMAIEAVSQAVGATRDTINNFNLRSVNILDQLELSSETNTEMELFTTLRPKALSFTAKSKDWWEFEIVSYHLGDSAQHATGSVSVQKSGEHPQSMLPYTYTGLEKSSPNGWYDKLAKQGLNFGPDVRSLKEIYTDCDKAHRYARTVTPLLQNYGKAGQHEPTYVIHPITIGALLQSGVIANAAGSIRNLEAKVPVSIESAVFRTPESPRNEESWLIDSTANVVGFGAIETNSELHNRKGQICAQMRNMRMASFIAPSKRQEKLAQRNPMLRVVWKPDPYGSCWTSNNFSRHVDDIKRLNPPTLSLPDEKRLIFAYILSLLSHKNPRLRILELSDENIEVSRVVLEEFSHSIRSYTAGYLSENGELFGDQVEIETTPADVSHSASLITDQTYDLIVLPNTVTADLYLHAMMADMKKFITGDGLILATTPRSQTYCFEANGFSTIHKNLQSTDNRIVVARLIPSDTGDERTTIIIERENAGRSSQVLASNLVNLVGLSARRITLGEVSPETIPSGAIVLSLLELERPLLSTLSEDEMATVKMVTDHASSIVWATGGGFLSDANPDFAVASGLARAIMLEQPSLSFYTYDLELADTEAVETAGNICAVLHQPPSTAVDYEFIQHDSLTYISRFVPDDEFNQVFRQKQGSETMSMSLMDAKPSRLHIANLGKFDTIDFTKEVSNPFADLASGYVEVEVQAVGLNAKDCHILGGHADSKDSTCSLEHCGIVRAVGSDVSTLGIGDRVVVMAPGHFKTHEIIPEWACTKLKDEEKFSVACTLPVVYSTALYALHHRACIQPGESVLIHQGADDVGNAAIQIAKLAGVEIFTTAGTEVQRNFLVNKFGLKRGNVFSSRNNSFHRGVMKATKGRGVDVVLNSLSGDLLHDSWSLCAPFGRFIELGDEELSHTGRLDMDVFRRNATFSALDMGSLFYDEHPTTRIMWAQLLAEVMTLYREGTIAAIEPLEVFDVSEVGRALQRYSREDRMGKVAISFENPNSILKVRHISVATILSSSVDIYITSTSYCIQKTDEP